MTKNSLFIHIESENTFYENFRTNENFFNFFLAQQDNNMAPIPKRIAYHYSFEKYTQKFLPSFSIDNVEKFDLFNNKSSKHLFYRFNNFTEASGGQKQMIKHTSKVKNSIGLEKIEQRDRHFLAEKVIHDVEFSSSYLNSTKKSPEIIHTV